MPARLPRTAAGRFCLALFVLSATVPARADVWGEPHPLRLDALLEGRSFEYNSEAFVKRFGYRHITDWPASGEDGVRGTGGSVTSDRLFLDVQMQKTLPFDGGRQEFFFNVQRAEDFDGSFDRQIIGLGHYPRENWRLAVMGEVPAGKDTVDFYVESRWQPDDDRMLRLAVIFPDALFDKADDGEYLDTPLTLFAHARGGAALGWHGEASISHSRRATFSQPARGVVASGDQTRTMVKGGRRHDRWSWQLRWEGERTDRGFVFDRPDQPPTDDFRRRSHALTLSATNTHSPMQPELGLRYVHFRERGWSGDARAVNASETRDESIIFLRGRLHSSRRNEWLPTLYLAYVDVVQGVDRGIGRIRDEREWQLTVALPWNYQIDAASGATLTVNPTFDLHRGWFGGGNVQLHWPL